MSARRLAAPVALAAIIAACGTAGTGSNLPPDTGSSAPPPAAGACLAGEPNCQDVGANPPPADLPPPSDSGSSGMLVNGGLTVSEALKTTATGTIAVQGFLFDDGSGPRLCDALAESYPPQCAVASLPVKGHEEMVNVPVQTTQGVSWTDQPVVFYGTITDGVLVVDPTVTG